MDDPAAATSALLAALPDLEASLGELEEKPWGETLDSLVALDRAKMDILLSYAINDLIWVYLKLKGTDPATHEVAKELDRVKRYYGKIRAAEDPVAQRNRVDKSAAHRFVLHSIPRSQRSAEAAPSDPGPPVGGSGDTSLAGRYRFIAPDGEVEKVIGDAALPDISAVGALDGDVDEEPGEDAEEDVGEDAEGEASPVEVGEEQPKETAVESPADGFPAPTASPKRPAEDSQNSTPRGSVSGKSKKKKNKNKKRKSAEGAI